MKKNKVEQVYDQIHAPEKLKQETFEKMKKSKVKKKANYTFILSVAAMFIFTFAIGSLYNNNVIKEKVKPLAIQTETPDLLHFKSTQEIRKYFNENYETTTAKEIYDFGIQEEATVTNDSVKTERTERANEKEQINYSKTNTQVENVDEADFSKTDGKYIYYVTNNTVYIVKANDLNLESKIDFSVSSEENKNYYPSELFIKGDKLVVIGNYIEYITNDSQTNETRKNKSINASSINTTKAYIYDISDKENPKELRQVAIDGDYDTSRLIGNSLYLISTKYMYYYPEMKDDEILPIYYDSISSDQYKTVECTDIVYCQGANNNIYKTIGAIDINSDDEILVESFLGYTSTVYCSENNLYLTSDIYNEGNTDILNSTEIYKFNISNGELKYVCKNTVDGNVNNQFSLDEYNGNLRVATTVTIQEEPNKTTDNGEYTTVEIGKTTTNNVLYVLNENLEKIGELTDFGVEEKIYSVRFIGDVAYIVTFEQIDPLFVIDLSDPQKPTIKGELKIPGYSSYLHPYDENHIIGIGYNVKDNGYGGVTNETVKISMFDVSDLSNPKEIFSKTLGEGYSYTNVTYDHKLLMYDKERNLMGFPINMQNGKGRYEDSILILNIDMENNEFKIHSKYTVDNSSYYIRKVMYIEDTLYILCDSEILSFDINTLEAISNLHLPYERQDRYLRTETVFIDDTLKTVE